MNIIPLGYNITMNNEDFKEALRKQAEEIDKLKQRVWFALGFIAAIGLIAELLMRYLELRGLK